MTVSINPSKLYGIVTAPPSKSAGHRSLICASLSNQEVKIKNLGTSDDITATINVLKALGAKVVKSDNATVVNPNLKPVKNVTLDCNESGSTARFMLPVVAALGCENAKFIGSGRLPLRPFGVLCDALRKNGVFCSSDALPITISGKLQNGTFELPGDISSQYISGLLFALSITKGISKIILTSPLQSAGYVDMTIAELKSFGAEIECIENGYKIYGKSSLIATDRIIEGDWSQAAFFLSAGAVLGKVSVLGLDRNSLQGDKEILNLLRRFGAKIKTLENGVQIEKSKLKSITIDATQIPDLVPILAVTAAFAEGTTVINGAGRLRLKESDRIKETVARLNAFGVSATETQDGLTITGSSAKGANITSGGDHRLAMAFSILASGANGISTIENFESINKSYPLFLEDFKTIGGTYNVI